MGSVCLLRHVFKFLKPGVVLWDRGPVCSGPCLVTAVSWYRCISHLFYRHVTHLWKSMWWMQYQVPSFNSSFGALCIVCMRSSFKLWTYQTEDCFWVVRICLKILFQIFATWVLKNIWRLGSETWIARDAWFFPFGFQQKLVCCTLQKRNSWYGAEITIASDLLSASL